jgi:hypothetical protein
MMRVRSTARGSSRCFRAKARSWLGQLGATLGGADGASGDLAVAFALEPAGEQVEAADDRRQHVVEVMGNAAGELANGLHLLRLGERRLGRGTARHLVAQPRQRRLLTLRPAQRRQRDEKERDGCRDAEEQVAGHPLAPCADDGCDRPAREYRDRIALRLPVNHQPLDAVRRGDLLLGAPLRDLLPHPLPRRGGRRGREGKRDRRVAREQLAFVPEEAHCVAGRRRD